MAKVIIVKKGGNVSMQQPCPFMIDAPSDTKR
jgi:hypothetical protein